MATRLARVKAKENFFNSNHGSCKDHDWRLTANAMRSGRLTFHLGPYLGSSLKGSCICGLLFVKVVVLFPGDLKQDPGLEN